MSQDTGSALTLTREQARFVGLYVAGVEGAASVDIYDLSR
jgi:hypothetical protein